MSWRILALLTPLCTAATTIRAANDTTDSVSTAVRNSSDSKSATAPQTYSLDVTASSSSTTNAHVADFILQGLGVSGEADTTESLSTYHSNTSAPLRTSTTLSSTQTTRSSPSWTGSSSVFPTLHIAGQNGTRLYGNSTTTRSAPSRLAQGYAAASSCQTDLYSWLNASRAYISSHAAETSYTSELSEITWTLTAPATLAHLDGGIAAARTTTLCDGNPRAIGPGRYLSSSTISGVYYTQTVTQLSGPYPTPAPCTIGAEECTQLHDWYNTAKLKVLYANTTMYEPPCATSGTAIPTGSVWCVPPMVPGYGNFTNEVLAEHAQLLYWPVRAKDDDTSKLFCTKANEIGAMQTAETIPGTRTADGPNTIVTDGITITSPTIAMVYSTVRRADGCGPTITKTIRTMLPEHLSSIRRNDVGAAPRYPFDYNDLNWMCESSDGTFTVQDGRGPDCYQNVPAAAYWQGPKMYMQYWNKPGVLNSTEVQDWTILNDYEPYIIEEETFTSELHELYGTNARWLQFGIWDPPIALIQQTAAAEPTFPHMLAATPATTTRTHVPEATPAVPAQPAVTELQKTEASLPNSYLTVPTSTADVYVGPHVGMAAQRPSSSVAQPVEAASSSPSPQTDDIVPSSAHYIGSAFVNAFANDATAVIVGSQTLAVGGDAQTVGGQVVSAAVPSAIIIGEGAAQSTMQLQSKKEQEQTPPKRIMVIGSVTLTQQSSGSGASGQVLQNADLTITLPKGQAAATSVTIDSWTLSPTIGAGGHYILQNAETAFTVQQVIPSVPSHNSPGPAGLPSTTPKPAVELHDANAILTINSMTLTASPAANYEVLYDAQTTVTIFQGAAITMGPHVVSVANSDGLARLAISSLSEQKQSANSTKVAKVKASTAASSLMTAETSKAAASFETSGTNRRSPGALASSISILCLAFASFML